MQTQARTPEEIRRSIEQTRGELVRSVDQLRMGVSRLTDWRRQVSEHKAAVVVGAAVAGFVIGGGIAAFGGALFRRR